MMRRNLPWVLMGFVSLAAVSARAADDTKARPPAADAPSPSGSEEAGKQRLSPWEPVDAAFRGCSEGLCGMRGRNPQAVVQPGAKVGQYTNCPVSGAVFRVKESSPQAEVDGKPVYLCCEGCARHLARNRDQVLALRGLAR